MRIRLVGSLLVAALGFLPVLASAQGAVTVSGTVLTASGAPIRGASVSIDALGIGVLARDDGGYTLQIPQGRLTAASLVISARALGYRPSSQTVQVAGATLDVNFTLADNPLRLGEIVVTGSGTSTSTERLGVERKSLDAVTLRTSNEPNVVQAIAGRLAGVQVNQQSGEAGSGSFIRIRGNRSFNGSGQPLWVVDGVPIISGSTSATNAVAGIVAPNRAGDINPDDIESMEILSGPSGAAIYGSLAGNGVVLVTTKKGRAGRTSWSLRTNFQSDQITRTQPIQRSFGVGNAGVTPACSGPTPPAGCFLSAGFQSWGAAIPAGTETFDNWANTYENGTIMDASLQASGGNDRTTFLLSVSNLTQDGFIVSDNDYYKRQTVRFNGSHLVTDQVKVGANVAYSQVRGSGIQRGNSINGLVLGAVRTPATFDNRNFENQFGQHVSWRLPNPTAAQSLTSRGFDNPFYAIYRGQNLADNNRVVGNVTANYTPLAWLTVDYNLGVDVSNDDLANARPFMSAGAPVGGSVFRFQGTDQRIDHLLTARAERELTSYATGRVQVGQQLNQFASRGVSSTGETLIAPLPFRLSNTTSYPPTNDGEVKTRLEAYFIQGQVDLFDQLYLIATVRNEGNSAFGIENQRAWFPQASAAWNFTNRFTTIPGVTYGKLRVAYGQSGLPPAPYLLQNVVGNFTYADFNPGSSMLATLNGIGGLGISGTRANPAIRPERISETSFGFDLGLLNDQYDVGVTRYMTNSDELIIAIPLAPSTGFTGSVANAGETQNRGWEVTLNGRPYTSTNYSFDFGINWAANESEVLSLGDPNLQFTGFGASFGGRYLSNTIGQQMAVIRGNDFARCGRGLTTIGANDIAAACTGQPAGALYIAATGFPITDPTDRVIGDPNPDWTGGLRLGATAHKVRFSAFFDHRQGGQMQNMTKASMYSFGTHKDTEVRSTVADRTFAQFSGETVVGPGAATNVAIGEGFFGGLGGIGGPAAQFNEDATFTRLRELSVSYTLDGSWVRGRLGLSSVDIRLAGRNLMVWTDYTGVDPESNIGGGAAFTLGYEWMNNPLSKSVVFSVGLNR